MALDWVEGLGYHCPNKWESDGQEKARLNEKWVS